MQSFQVKRGEFLLTFPEKIAVGLHSNLGFIGSAIVVMVLFATLIVLLTFLLDKKEERKKTQFKQYMLANKTK